MRGGGERQDVDGHICKKECLKHDTEKNRKENKSKTFLKMPFLMTAIDEETRHAWMCVSGWARHHQRLSSRNFFFCCRQQKLLLVKMIRQITTTTGVWFIFHLTSSSSFSLLRRMDVFFVIPTTKKSDDDAVQSSKQKHEINGLYNKNLLPSQAWAAYSGEEVGEDSSHMKRAPEKWMFSFCIF